jgi:hypothetical protein
MIELSPVQLARAVSDLTGLSDFEDAAKSLSKTSRAYNKSIKEAENRIDKFDERLSKYDGLLSIRRRYDKLLKDYKIFSEESEKEKSMSELGTRYNSVLEQGKSIATNLKKTKEISTDFSVDSINEDVANLIQLIGFIERWSSANHQIHIIDSNLLEVKKIEPIEIEDVSHCRAIFELYNKWQETCTKIHSKEGTLASTESFDSSVDVSSVQRLREMIQLAQSHSAIMASGKKIFQFLKSELFTVFEVQYDSSLNKKFELLEKYNELLAKEDKAVERISVCQEGLSTLDSCISELRAEMITRGLICESCGQVIKK